MEHSLNSATHVLRTQLPVTRVKKIFRLDSDCTTISAEAVQILTFATERFVGLLAKLAYGQAVFDKRKTIQLRDLEFCMKNYEPFSFLDGTLDGWPEVRGGKHGFADDSNFAVAATLDANNEYNEQEDLNVESLNDEIFDFDDSLKPPFGGQIVEKLSTTVTAEKKERVEDVSEIQSHKLEVLSHYGYCFPTNSTFAPLNEIVEANVKADMKHGVQRDNEMDIEQQKKKNGN